MEKALFEFMFSTGCRIGEIVSLEKKSYFPPKQLKERSLINKKQ
ncbi:hypothetical protein [Neobacillus cucumis]|nr:hypothetical protein [Neobacillus cucumis]